MAGQSLAGDTWARVVAGVVNVRSGAGLGSSIRGTVLRGQIVYIHPTAPRDADGYRWYDVQATPGLRGWVASADAVEVLLGGTGASASVEWCAVPAVRTIPLAADRPSPSLVLGDVPLRSDQFSLAALLATDLAWADGHDPVCATLSIGDGVAVAAHFDADFETCGHPFQGAVGWYLDYPDAPGGHRLVPIGDPILGYDPYAPPLENPDQLLILDGARLNGNAASSRIFCVGLTVSGGESDTATTARFWADVCAEVVSVDEGQVVLRGIAPWDGRSDVEFIRYPGSEIDPIIQPGSTLGIAVEADGGVDGAVRMRPATVPECS
jgi:hypothetical protein